MESPTANPTLKTFQLILDSPDAKNEVQKAITHLWDQVEVKKFNRDRAVQVFEMAIEHALSGFYSSMKLPYRRKDFPSEWTHTIAIDLADKFILEGNIPDQRQVRRGLNALILGK